MSPKIDEQHLIPSEIWYQELAANFPAIRVQNKHASATIALHGANVIDFTPMDQMPVIFTSEKAIFRQGSAIRGGIPVCWPWFNAHPTDNTMPSHGFARNHYWELIDSNTTENFTQIILELNTNSIDIWNFNTKVTLTIKVGKSLCLELRTKNNDDSPVIIGGALHSYFYVSDVREVTLSGLDKINYINTLTDETEVQHGALQIHSEIDNIYLNSRQSIQINDPKFQRTIHVEKSGSKSTVIWNPWIDKSKQLADLGNDEFYQFVCVEAANAHEDTYTLAPASEHTLSTTISSIFS